MYRNPWVCSAFDERSEKVLTLLAGRFGRHCFSMDCWRRLRAQESMKFEGKLVFVGCASEAEVPNFCRPYQASNLLIL